MYSLLCIWSKCCFHPWIPYQRCVKRHLRYNCSHLIASHCVDELVGSGDKPGKKAKKMIRMAGGQMWEDPSLLTWDNNDFRNHAITTII